MTPTQKSAMLSALRALSCIEYGFIGITDGPSEATTESAMQELEAALAEPQESVVHMYLALADAMGYDYRPNELTSAEEWAAKLYAHYVATNSKEKQKEPARGAFERHAESLGYSVDPDTREGREGGYWSSHTQLMWLTWQAALSQPAQPVQEPAQLEEHCLWARNGNEPCPHAQKVEQESFLGWLFKRNADGSIGIFAPPPKPGESKRTSDCVGTNQRDLNELLGKLADHMAAAKSSPLQGAK